MKMNNIKGEQYMSHEVRDDPAVCNSSWSHRSRACSKHHRNLQHIDSQPFEGGNVRVRTIDIPSVIPERCELSVIDSLIETHMSIDSHELINSHKLTSSQVMVGQVNTVSVVGGVR